MPSTTVGIARGPSFVMQPHPAPLFKCVVLYPGHASFPFPHQTSRPVLAPPTQVLLIGLPLWTIFKVAQRQAQQQQYEEMVRAMDPARRVVFRLQVGLGFWAQGLRQKKRVKCNSLGGPRKVLG